MNTVRTRIGIGAIAGVVLAVALGILQPAAAQAQPAGCSGPDAPPACGHQPPAPPLLLRTPSFKADSFDFFRVGVTLDPSTVARYAAGSTLPYRVQLNCSSGFTTSFPLTLTSDKHNAYSDLEGWSLAPGDTCSFSTDAWVALRLSHAVIERESDGSWPGTAWVADFS
jgi:hypothetical protein